MNSTAAPTIDSASFPLIASLKPHDCFVYPRCSAQVCPFDPSWKKYWHYRGESVCSLLKESVKPTTADVFFTTYFSEGLRLLEELRALTPHVIRQHPIVRLQLAAAAESGSRYKQQEGANSHAVE